ncbi:hypothetical protein Drorol1_Dr00001031 [Drosera rotundifolia]
MKRRRMRSDPVDEDVLVMVLACDRSGSEDGRRGEARVMRRRKGEEKCESGDVVNACNGREVRGRRRHGERVEGEVCDKDLLGVVEGQIGEFEVNVEEEAGIIAMGKPEIKARARVREGLTRVVRSWGKGTEVAMTASTTVMVKVVAGSSIVVAAEAKLWGKVE